MEFAVDSTAAGTRTLTFRYANGSSIDRPLELRVNGVRGESAAVIWTDRLVDDAR